MWIWFAKKPIVWFLLCSEIFIVTIADYRRAFLRRREKKRKRKKGKGNNRHNGTYPVSVFHVTCVMWKAPCIGKEQSQNSQIKRFCLNRNKDELSNRYDSWKNKLTARYNEQLRMYPNKTLSMQCQSQVYNM